MYANGESTFAYFPRVSVAEETAARFRKLGVEARAISADTPRLERDSIIQKFRSGRIKILCNVDILTEGVDIPEAGCVLLARQCLFSGYYLQVVGRGARSSPGKEYFTLIDLCGSSHLHGMPTDDREYSLTGRPIKLAGNTEMLDEKEPVEAIDDNSGYEFSPEILNLALEEVGYIPKNRPPVGTVRAEDPRKTWFDARVVEALNTKKKLSYVKARFRAEYSEAPPAAWLLEADKMLTRVDDTQSVPTMSNT
jgi:superfamily II DNA or RNA helicase